MKVTSATFLKSVMHKDHYPKDRRPEFAFVGRSNVGKSTLLNALLGKKGLAKTSATPGKTQTVNFFDINEKFYFVDLPGYGYAKVPLKVKADWNRVMLDYLREREPLRLVTALIDARHEPSERDAHMIELLGEAQKPTLIVATKLDKLKSSEKNASIKRIRDTLGLDKDAMVIPVSALEGIGLKEVWQVIDDFLK